MRDPITQRLAAANPVLPGQRPTDDERTVAERLLRQTLAAPPAAGARAAGPLSRHVRDFRPRLLLAAGSAATVLAVLLVLLLAPGSGDRPAVPVSRGQSPAAVAAPSVPAISSSGTAGPHAGSSATHHRRRHHHRGRTRRAQHQTAVAQAPRSASTPPTSSSAATSSAAPAITGSSDAGNGHTSAGHSGSSNLQSAAGY